MKKGNNKWIIFGILVGFTATLVLPGVSLGDENSSPFIVGLNRNPSTLDPLQCAYYDYYKSHNVIRQVCEGLFRYNYSSTEMEPIPQLANDMGLIYGNNLSITLRNDVIFHDGSKFNASAVKWTFDRMQYFSSGLYVNNGTGKEFWQYNESFRAYDSFDRNGIPFLNTTVIESEFNITFVLNFGVALWISLLAHPASSIMLPDANYEKGVKFLNYLSVEDLLLGTGPYCITELKLADYPIDGRILFRVFENYYLERPEGYITILEYRIYSRGSLGGYRSLIAFLNHEVYWVESPYPYEYQIEADENLINHRVPSYSIMYIAMSTVNIPLEVRQAITYVNNITDSIEENFGRDFDFLNVSIPERMQYHNSSFDGIPYYNVTKARALILSCTELLANASTSGLSLENSTEEWRTTAESSSPIAWYNFSMRFSYYWEIYLGFIDILKDIGIKVDARWYYDFPNYSPCYPASLNTYSFGIWFGDSQVSDPTSMLDFLFHSKGYNANQSCSYDWGPEFIYNYFMMNDSLLDFWIEQAYNVTGDSRRVLFNQIQERIVRDLAPCIIYQEPIYITYNKIYVNESTISDMLNPFGEWYWFNVQFIPPTILDNIETYLFIGGMGLLGLSALVVGSVYFGKWVKRKLIKR